MAGILLCGFFSVGYIVYENQKNEPVDGVLLQLPSEEVVVLQLLVISRNRLQASEVVQERGVLLRPVRAYAEDVFQYEQQHIQKLESLPHAEEGAVSISLDWSGVSNEDVQVEYIKFERANLQLAEEVMRQASGLMSSTDLKVLAESMERNSFADRLGELETLLLPT